MSPTTLHDAPPAPARTVEPCREAEQPGSVQANTPLRPVDNLSSITAGHSTPQRTPRAAPEKLRFTQRVEAFISRLSTKNNFWHKVCSLIWLPYAFRSGITMRRLDETRFTAVLPFKRINRNWYNAMAGAALLGNSEVAGGMYLFSECGSDYIVVCKDLKYKFLRPCYGPAVYHILDAEDVKRKIAAGGEFNVNLHMEIRQQLKKRGKERRVGRCEITFHCTPKAHVRNKAARAKRVDGDDA